MLQFLLDQINPNTDDMKKTLLFCLIFYANAVFAQLTYVPDDNFEQELIYLGYDDVIDDYVLTANIIEVTVLDVSSRNISSLAGIEDFAGLKHLNCEFNELSTLDITQNVGLLTLMCFSNQLSQIDFSQNPLLYFLRCEFNQLTHLDFSQNLDLTDLYCENNQLNQLNISQNTVLRVLHCNSNDLNNLDISQSSALEYLACENNQLTHLDISQNTALTQLFCRDNYLTLLDTSQNLALTQLWCRSNQLINLNFSQNVNLAEVKCHFNQLINLDLRNGNNTNIPNDSFNAFSNPDLTCIFVDDAAWSIANWTNIDSNSTFVETQAECDALGLDEIEFNELIEVFPNPTNDSLNIRLTNGIESSEVVLYNVLGNSIIKTNNNFMDVSNLETGIYILRIITKDDRILSKRIIIEDE